VSHAVEELQQVLCSRISQRATTSRDLHVLGELLEGHRRRALKIGLLIGSTLTFVPVVLHALLPAAPLAFIAMTMLGFGAVVLMWWRIL
jgi:hypothetical protein